jgi:hypothetical protein
MPAIRGQLVGERRVGHAGDMSKDETPGDEAKSVVGATFDAAADTFDHPALGFWAMAVTVHHVLG